MKSFFLSLRTTVWTLLALVCIFFVGSFLMPLRKDIFGPMNDLLLFQWAEEIGLRNFGATWWFFASIAALALLTINTLVCSYPALRGSWRRRDALARLAPQVTHLGFLFILLAHLIGAGWGYKLSGVMPQGASARLPEGVTLHLREVRADLTASGYPKSWAADVILFADGQRVAAGTLGPNQPLFHRGAGIYLKHFELGPRPVAFLLVTKDPGALWALVGAVLFGLGTIALVVLKWKRPEAGMG